MPHTNPGTTTGRATTLPTGTDVYGYMDQQLAADPSFQPPPGYQVQNGHVVKDQPGFLLQHPWLIPLLGVGAGAGLTLAAGAGVGGAATGAGAGGEASAGVGPLAGGYGAATTSAAAPAGIAANGGGGILSGIGSVLGGGQSLTSPGGIMNAAGRIGGALSGIEADRQAGRQAEGNATQAQDRNAISAAALNLQAPDKRLATSVHGDVAANAQDFSYGAPTMVGNIPVPTSTGGLRPSIFSANTRALGALTSQQALANETADGGKPAQLTPLPQASTTDSILNGAGSLLSLAGAIPYKAPPRTQPIFYSPTGGR
jgi:hypothetical protein